MKSLPACLSVSVFLLASAPAFCQEAQPEPAEKLWLESVRPFLVPGSSVPLGRFDELFGDAFFGRRWDPFQEMERVQRRMESLLSPQEAKALQPCFRDWFSARMDMSDVATYIRYDKEQITVRLKVPGLLKDSAVVGVSQDRIRLSYLAKTVNEEWDAIGRVAGRSESSISFEKLMPVPAGADPGSAKVSQEAGMILIAFARKKLPS